MSAKLDLELERAERNRLANDKGTQLVRYAIALPNLSQIKFNAQYGWQQMIQESVVGLPANTRAVILNFSLTDLNLRRAYGSLVVYQAGSPAKVDLTNFFFVGPLPLPPFGLGTEVILPWDDKLDAKLVVEFHCAATHQIPPPNPYSGLGGYGGYGGYGGPGMPPPISASQSPYAYACISISGFQFKM